ncbi:AAA family ATPase [Phytomonospora sp. NPDC050363]|uniref:dephospho-CoA kinase n=1 Tax=Phytomonospora sp. NPDC050363 TaxID=3155642 RepID=UPI0033EA3594
MLITGMSGTGKSTVLAELAERGYTTVDADADEWSHWGLGPDGKPDWMWREDRMAELLSTSDGPGLFVAGTSVNQGKFYAHFDKVVLFSAPPAVMLERIASRTNNEYGKSPEQWVEVLRNLETVEPLLRRGADAEIDTSGSLEDVVAAVLRLADGGSPEG